jgi:hypothetical protein
VISVSEVRLCYYLLHYLWSICLNCLILFSQCIHFQPSGPAWGPINSWQTQLYMWGGLLFFHFSLSFSTPELSISYLYYHKKSYWFVRFQVLKAVSMKISSYCVIMPCSLTEVDQRFRAAYFLHHRDNQTTWCNIAEGSHLQLFS